MEAKIKDLKKKFDRDLKHIKIILTDLRPRLPFNIWLQVVEETKEAILDSPDTVFCYPVPPSPVVTAAIEQVFKGFLEDQRIRASQIPIVVQNKR